MFDIKNILNYGVFLVQVSSAFVVTFLLYMVFAMFDYQGGLPAFVGLALFQPMLGLIFASTSVIFCILPGLPIRLHMGINRWWRKHFYVATGIAFLGLLFSALSMVPSWMQTLSYDVEGVVSIHRVPNQFLSISGWYMVTFGILHQYPPKIAQDWLENRLKVLE